VTKRKPLQWYSATDGSDREFPGCMTCAELLFSPMFMEAVYSVSIETPGSPDELARRTINVFHARRHPDDMAPS
jgi:hypothetical protein